MGNRIAYVAAVLVWVLLYSGCTWSGEVVPSSRQAIEPYFEEASPGILRGYDAFYVAPIEACTLEKDSLRRVEQPDVIKLAESFRRKLIKQLGSRAAMLPQPARNVALLQVTIADVSSTYASFQLLPGYIVPNMMRGGASIEARFLDSVSNRQIALFRDTRQGDRAGFFSGLGKWDGVERAFDEWAQLLASQIRR